MANFFKLINITSSLPKRHANKNTTVQIKYGSAFKSSTKDLLPGEEMFIICNRLPMNIQKLNLEKLIVVNRITENEYERAQKKSSIPKKVEKVVKPKAVVEKKVSEKTQKTYKKKSTTKKSFVE